MDVKLVMFRESGERRAFPLLKDVTVIGRREDCDLRIALREVSRRHCRISRNGLGFVVEDLDSSNGTFVNGKKVVEIDFHPGDSLQIGPLVFVLQVDGSPAVDEMKPIRTAKPTPSLDDDDDEFDDLLRGLDDNQDKLS